jgi:hypothetical protein
VLEEESQKQRLIKLAKANSEFYFKDQYKKTYAKIRLKDHSEIISLDSNKFKYFLSKLYYDYTKGMVVNQESLNDTIRVIEANTVFEGPTIPLNLRTAWSSTRDAIYYDMIDEKWRCIKITKDGWNIINSSETSTALFIRFNQNPQVVPERNYDSEIFDKFLDLTNIIDPKNRLLTKVWVISLFIPDIPHAINITHGEKGSAKTTFCVMIKDVIDPDALGLLTTPNDKKEFVQQLSHNHLVVYDNVAIIIWWYL